MAYGTANTVVTRKTLRAGQDSHDSYENIAPSFLESFIASRFIAGFFGFLIMCGLAATFSFGRVPPTQFPEHGWASWAIADFLSLKQKPQIVFLGSSLMLVPLAGVDANFLKRRLDGSKHHHSAYFEQAFKSASGLDVRTFNLALPGEMPSDAYLATDFLLDGGKKPDVIVYGLGPRDFMDNLLPSPSATDPFRNFSRFGDIGPFLDRVMPDFMDKLNFHLARTFYLYGLKADLVAQTGNFLTDLSNKFLPVPRSLKAYSVAQRRLLLPDYRPAELTPGEAFFRPAEKETFADNLTEYKKRYATVRWDTFTTQMRFFVELLDVANRRGIHVVIVSMPITKLNRSLIADYAWDAYRKSLHVIATVKGAKFVDLQGSDKFDVSDFMDTVHLHAGGGKKLLDILSATIANDKAALAALKPAPPDGQPDDYSKDILRSNSEDRLKKVSG